jgi:glycosyltransferase involved in cell wall biosynthesis
MTAKHRGLPSDAVRVGLLGNIANNAFNMVNILRRHGIDAQLVLTNADLFAFSRPAWEEIDATLTYQQVMERQWSEVEWRKFERAGGWKPQGRVIYPHRCNRWLDSLARIIRPGAPDELHEEHLLKPFDDEDCRNYMLQMRIAHRDTIKALRAFDVLIVFGSTAAICAYWAAKPTIYFTYGGDCRLELANAGGKYPVLSRCFRSVLASRQFMIEGYGCDEEIHYILKRNGLLNKTAYAMLGNVNTNLFAPRDEDQVQLRRELGWNTEGLLFFLASRVDYRWKRTDVFLKAFSDFAKDRPRTRLVITGWGADFDHARRRIQEHGLGDQVHFLAHSLSKPLLYRCYAASDVVVDQFQVGSLGSVSYEAMSMGKPVLTYLAAFNMQCYSAPPPVLNGHSEQDIRQLLEWCHDCPRQLAKLGDECAKWYSQTYSEDNLPRAVHGIVKHGPERWRVFAETRCSTAPTGRCKILGSDSSIQLLPWPHPYRAGLTIANDCEYYQWRDFCRIHRWLNNAQETEYGPGLNLPVSDSLWFYSERPEQLGMSYFGGSKAASASALSPYMTELLRMGLLDTLHSYGGFDMEGSFTRDHAARVVDELDRLDVKLRVWTNHGNANNIQNLGGLWPASYTRGDMPGQAAFHADLLKEVGCRYFWLDTYATNQFALGVDGAEGFSHDLAQPTVSPARARVLSPEQLRDGQHVLAFQRFRGARQLAPDPDSLSRGLSPVLLDHLQNSGGAAIIYQHLGCRREPDGKPVCRNGEMLPSAAISSMRELADRHHGKSIWIAPLGRFLRYCETVGDIRVSARMIQGGAEIRVASHRSTLNEDDLAGIHLLISPEIHIREVLLVDDTGAMFPCSRWRQRATDSEGILVFWPWAPTPAFPFTGDELAMH